jgi:hypothetical protein
MVSHGGGARSTNEGQVDDAGYTSYVCSRGKVWNGCGVQPQPFSEQTLAG